MPSNRLHNRFITSLTSFSVLLPLNFIGDVIIRIIAIYVKNKSVIPFYNNSLCFIFCVPTT